MKASCTMYQKVKFWHAYLIFKEHFILSPTLKLPPDTSLTFGNISPGNFIIKRKTTRVFGIFFWSWEMEVANWKNRSWYHLNNFTGNFSRNSHFSFIDFWPLYWKEFKRGRLVRLSIDIENNAIKILALVTDCQSYPFKHPIF